MKKIAALSVSILLFFSCSVKEDNKLDVKSALSYCNVQLQRTLSEMGDTTLVPHNIPDSLVHWTLVSIYDWTSGFFPGSLWYNYEYTQDEAVKQHAIHYTELLEPLSLRKARDHDLGFQIFCSYGNAYRLTGNEAYKDVILRTADTLAALYNPTVGTILSWPGMVQKKQWPHNTIIDNLMNLELLFWASKNGPNKSLYDLAVSHARVTMENHFREDGSSHHVAVYDTVTGNFIQGVTHQGYSDSSLWARGQAWAVYGYTMVYRETKDPIFLRFAEKIADLYLSRLPQDYVPYWDFDAPGIPNEPRDASAAAIVSSALLELSSLEDDASLAKKYKNEAIKMLKSLSSESYQSREAKPSLLLHCTGNLPVNCEVDASIIYADYYYLEALMRYNRLIGE